MKSLEEVRRQLSSGDFEFSRHAFRRSVERNISEREIREAGSRADIIENYPDDKYAPSALLLGLTAGGRALHFQVALDSAPFAKIITIYEPNPNEWIDHRKRR